MSHCHFNYLADAVDRDEGHSGRMEYGRSLFVLRKSRPVTPEVAGSSPVSRAQPSRGIGRTFRRKRGAGEHGAYPMIAPMAAEGKGAEQIGLTPTKRPRNP